jgi:hypothetical protein
MPGGRPPVPVGGISPASGQAHRLAPQVEELIVRLKRKYPGRGGSATSCAGSRPRRICLGYFDDDTCGITVAREKRDGKPKRDDPERLLNGTPMISVTRHCAIGTGWAALRTPSTSCKRTQKSSSAACSYDATGRSGFRPNLRQRHHGLCRGGMGTPLDHLRFIARFHGFGGCPVLHRRSCVGEPAHQCRDCSRGHRIREGLTVRRWCHDSNRIVEHAASSRRVIDALMRQLPSGRGQGRQKSWVPLCAGTRGMSRLIVAELARRHGAVLSALSRRSDR